MSSNLHKLLIYCADWGGSSALSPTPSSEGNSLSTELSPWGKETALSESASEPWEVALHPAAEEGERDSPVSIPSATSTCDPHDRNPEERCRELPLQREPSRSEASTARGARNADSQLPRELTQSASLPSEQHKGCVYPCP